jgi:hypothetical protein
MSGGSVTILRVDAGLFYRAGVSIGFPRIALGSQENTLY